MGQWKSHSGNWKCLKLSDDKILHAKTWDEAKILCSRKCINTKHTYLKLWKAESWSSKHSSQEVIESKIKLKESRWEEIIEINK